LAGQYDMSVRADAETFRSIPLFAECEAVHLQLLAFSAVRQTFEPGELVIKQNFKGAAAFLLLSGRVDIATEQAGKIGSAGPGAMLGEVAMIGDAPYAISARTTEAVAAARIDRSLFMRLVKEYPEFGAAVFRALSRKLDTSMDDLGGARLAFDRARSFKNL
jgi:CRP/FNR family cyclic AMP-dependent transcriptional regulator